MTESGREEVLEDALRTTADLLKRRANAGAWHNDPLVYYAIREVVEPALASPSTQEPAVRSGKVEEIARECARDIFSHWSLSTDTLERLHELAAEKIAAALRAAGESAAAEEQADYAAHLLKLTQDRLTAERQRRRSAEKVALPLSQGWQSYGGTEKDKAGLLRGTLCIWDFENAAKHFSRYAHADDLSEEGKGG